MSIDSLARVEKEAQRLLNRLGISEPAVDVEAIATQLGLDVRRQRFDDDLSGVLVKTVDRTTIGVNSRHGLLRQRFSIAHEIAHYWLEHPGDMFVDEARGQASVIFRDGRSSDGTNLHEMEANRFAAALLMPVQLLFDSFMRCLSDGLSNIDKEIVPRLATEYRVSNQAMKIRLSSVGLTLIA